MDHGFGGEWLVTSEWRSDWGEVMMMNERETEH
jgi:hypothetical protein